MLAIKRSTSVVPEVNLRNSSHANNKACKKWEVVTKSPKQGYQWPHKRDSCPPKILKEDTGPNRNALFQTHLFAKHTVHGFTSMCHHAASLYLAIYSFRKIKSTTSKSIFSKTICDICVSVDESCFKWVSIPVLSITRIILQN